MPKIAPKPKHNHPILGENGTQKAQNDEKEQPKIKEKISLNQYTAIWDVIKRDGFWVLYKGAIPGMIGQIYINMVYFFLYSVFGKLFFPDLEELHSKHVLLITTLAGMLTTFCANPYLRIQTKITVDESNRGFIDHFKTVVRTEGFFALWKGCGFSLILVLNPVINYVIYEKLKLIVILANKGIFYSLLTLSTEPLAEEVGNPLTVYNIMVISILSKLCATLVTYPIITLRTKAYTGADKVPALERLREFIQTEGLLAFYRGLDTKLVRTLLSNALQMIIYEKFRFFMGNTTKPKS